MFCTHCNINWASLHTEYDHVGEEQYDVCPQCKTDQYLEEKKEGSAYLFSQITGEIIDALTKEPLDRTVYKEHSPVVIKRTSEEEWYDRRHAFADREDRALEAYQREYELGGRERAEQVYFQVMTARYDKTVNATIIEKAAI